jgi:hypothetical protein
MKPAALGRMLSHIAAVSSHFRDPACLRRQSRRYLPYARVTPNGRSGRIPAVSCGCNEEVFPVDSGGRVGVQHFGRRIPASLRIVPWATGRTDDGDTRLGMPSGVLTAAAEVRGESAG